MHDVWQVVIAWLLRIAGPAVGVFIAFTMLKSATLPAQLGSFATRLGKGARKMSGERIGTSEWAAKLEGRHHDYMSKEITTGRFAKMRNWRRRQVAKTHNYEQTRKTRESLMEQQRQAAFGEYAKDNAEFIAAGIGGEMGATRVQASAVSAVHKAEDEKLANTVTLLSGKIKDAGIDQKSLASQLSKYLDDPTGDYYDINGDKRANSQILGPNGKIFDLSKDLDKETMKAALHMAAGAREESTIRSARKSNLVNQTDLDDVIYRNDGALKSAGAYDLATDYSLAYGRDGKITAGTKMYNEGAQELAAAKSIGDAAAVTAAEDKKKAGAALATSVMTQSGVNALAQSSLEDFAGMKSGTVGKLAEAMAKGIQPTRKDGSIDTAARAKLINTLNAIPSSPAVAARLTPHKDMLDRATDVLNGRKPPII